MQRNSVHFNITKYNNYSKHMKTNKFFLGALMIGAAALTSCAEKQPELTKSGLDPQKFVAQVGDKQTALYTLTNANGLEACITNFGGRIVSLMVPDRDGNFQDVVLGFDNVQNYIEREKTPSDYGACIGRYANRIAKGKFTLDEVEYDLPKNNFGHCLHGGTTGWQYSVYEAVEVSSNSVKLQLVSPDGDNGFPGTVTASCTYTLDDNNVLTLKYEATTDKATIINMTNHSYINLNGDPSTDCMDNILYVASTKMTPVDNTYMTYGEISDIPAGDPFDFSTAKPMGQDIDTLKLDRQSAAYTQLVNGNGYDHNWVLNEECQNMQAPCCTLYSPKTGIKLTQYTTEPGVQVYTGNFQDGTYTGKKGIVYPQRCAVCLETQKYPNTPNTPEWPSCVLRPGEKYESTTTFAFSVE